MGSIDLPVTPTNLRDRSLIKVGAEEGGGGYKIGKSRVLNLFVPSHLETGKSCPPPPPLKSGNLLHPPSVWLKVEAPVLKLHENFYVPLQYGYNSFHLPPFFCRGKTLLAPPPSPWLCKTPSPSPWLCNPPPPPPPGN